MGISLEDSNGNPIAPDIHTLDIRVQGGYLIDGAGQRVTQMNIHALDAYIPLEVE